MGLGSEYRAERYLVAVYGACSAPLLIFGGGQIFALISTLGFLALALSFLLRFRDLSKLGTQIGWTVLGLVYLPLLLGHLLPLRMLEDGRGWIFLSLIAVMSCDSCAYFVGSKIGKHKLYAAVSPNKSIEGAIGGLAGAVLGVWLSKLFFMPFIGWLDGLLIGLLIGVAGQLGDLFESLLKRACNVKDSGNLIPGHGGLLDRLDSLLFTFPLVYYIAACFSGGQ